MAQYTLYFITLGLFLSSFLQFIIYASGESITNDWIPSTHLSTWYHPFDLCLLTDGRNSSIDEITKDCETKIVSDKFMPAIPPVRCRVGNTWPSRSQYCDPSDIPFSKRKHLLESLSNFDQPSLPVLKEFFKDLATKKGMLLLVGDSVMQQFFSALACELEREGVWPDASVFTNTDETRHVIFHNISVPSDHHNKTLGTHTATIKFVPVYHLVNGRYDRVPQAAFHALKQNIHSALEHHQALVILINMGLHYIDNPEKGFSKQDYSDQVTTVLSYLHNLVIERPRHDIRVIWRETTAQHFPTPNGYWPGAKYAGGMKIGCQPIQDTSPQADWRNRAVEQVIIKNNLFNIKMLRFYNITLPLWSEHPNGNLKDCTHFCWFPMLYQPIFYFLRDTLLK